MGLRPSWFSSSVPGMSTGELLGSKKSRAEKEDRESRLRRGECKDGKVRHIDGKPLSPSLAAVYDPKHDKYTDEDLIEQGITPGSSRWQGYRW